MTSNVTSPPATPDYAARAAFHERGAEAVRRKVMKLYGLASEQLDWPKISQSNDWAVTLQMDLRQSVRSDYWLDARTYALENAGYDPEDSKRGQLLDTVAEDILQRYAEAFNLRRAIDSQTRRAIPEASKRYVADVRPHTELVNIFINHRSNQAEAQLCATGLPPVDAHRLHARLIGMARQICLETEQLRSYTNIQPQLGSPRHASASEVKYRLDTLGDYWKSQRDNLQTRHADYTPGKSR